MNVPIPPEFEAFARTQVAAGRYASEAEVVAEALKQYLADPEGLARAPRSGDRTAGARRGAAVRCRGYQAARPGTRDHGAKS